MSNEKKFYGWKLLAVLWIVYFVLAAFPFYGGVVMNTYMAIQYDMSRTILGFGLTVFLIVQGFSAPVVAMVVNKRGIRDTILIGSAFLIIGTIIMGFMVKGTVAYILAFGVLIGLGFGFGTTVPVTTGVMFWFKRKRSLAMAVVLTAGGIGGVTAVPVLVKTINTFNGNWQAGWLLITALVVLTAIMTIIFVKNKPSDLGQVPDGKIYNEDDTAKDSIKKVYQTKDEWTPKEVLKTSTYWLMVIAVVSFCFPYYAFMGHGVINFLDKGISTEVAAMSVGLITLFGVLGRLAVGVLGDRIDPRYIWIVAQLLYIPGSLAALNASGITSIYIYSICIGIGFGSAYVCMSSSLGNYFGAKTFASLMGVLMPIIALSGALGPVIAGMVFDTLKSYNVAFVGAAIFSLIGAVCLIFASPTIKKTV